MLEYQHVNLNNTTIGNVELGFTYPEFTGYILDLNDNDKSKLNLVKNLYDGESYLFNNFDDSESPITNNSIKNLVFPTTKSKSVFVSPEYNLQSPYTDFDIHFTDKNGMNIEVSTWDDNSTDVFYDTVILHCTNGIFNSNYDSLILNISIKSGNNNVNLSSILLSKSDELYLESSPLLVGEKLYTKNYKFRIPSLDWLLHSEHGKNLATVLSDGKLDLDATLKFSLFGITESYTNNSFTFYKTAKIQSISIQSSDTNSSLSVRVEHATDGDYFILQALVNDGNIQLSDYLSTLGGSYSVMHDIMLTEFYIDDIENKVKSKITHRQYSIAAMDSDTDIEDKSIFNDPLYFRPVLLTRNTYYFVISDTLRIYNNGDNTTIIKNGMCKYGDMDDESVGIYGKRIQPLTSLSSQLLRVNVYNKRTDIDLDTVTIKNTNIGKISSQTNNYNITSFIDTKNIAISTQNVTVSNINENS